MTTTLRHTVLLALLAAFAFPSSASAQEDVPWYQPNPSIDQAAPEPQPPPKIVGRPPGSAFALELGPVGYLGSNASGVGTFLKLKYSFDKSIGLVAGLLLPGGVLAGGLELNPLGGVSLAQIDETISVWLLGPRTTLLALLGPGSPTGLGVGGQFAPIGGRVSFCTPTCFFADLRVLEFSGLLYMPDTENADSAVFLPALGGNLAAGVAF